MQPNECEKNTANWERALETGGVSQTDHLPRQHLVLVLLAKSKCALHSAEPREWTCLFQVSL